MEADAAAGGEDAGGQLRADSVAVLLGQALQAQDRALLEKCAAHSITLMYQNFADLPSNSVRVGAVEDRFQHAGLL